MEPTIEQTNEEPISNDETLKSEYEEMIIDENINKPKLWQLLFVLFFFLVILFGGGYWMFFYESTQAFNRLESDVVVSEVLEPPIPVKKEEPYVIGVASQNIELSNDENIESDNAYIDPEFLKTIINAEKVAIIAKENTERILALLEHMSNAGTATKENTEAIVISNESIVYAITEQKMLGEKIYRALKVKKHNEAVQSERKLTTFPIKIKSASVWGGDVILTVEPIADKGFYREMAIGDIVDGWKLLGVDYANSSSVWLTPEGKKHHENI